MKISIITPVKNSERFIIETIESVINQIGNFEIEYLIIDGGSTDNTLKICQEYQQQLKNIERKIFCNSIDFKIISEPDIGMYDALTKGLKLVAGDVICYINADDFYLPNAFNCVSEIFLKFDKVSWVTGLPIRYNEEGHIVNFQIPWQYNSDLISKGINGKLLPFIQQESVFWRNDLNKHIDLEKLKEYKLAGDYFLWYSFAKQETKLYLVDSFLGGNRLRRGQLSEDKKAYHMEFDTIKDESNFFDNFKTLFYWVIEKFAGTPIKRKFSRNRVTFRNGSWMKK